MGTTIDTITDEQIVALMSEAEKIGDRNQAAICHRALNRGYGFDQGKYCLSVATGISPNAARAECARVIALNEAQ